MGLNKTKGNMYSWVTHTHAHLGGECPHQCQYCYVGTSRYGRLLKYTGELRLIESEFKVDYGKGKTIFMEHMNDAFADAVPMEFIKRILAHCNLYQENTYVFQSKNPKRFLQVSNLLPPHVILGTTIETNRTVTISKAPSPLNRGIAIQELPFDIETFITIEPIMKFDLDDFVYMLKMIKPTFINIGADSKNCGLSEPTKSELENLIKEI